MAVIYVNNQATEGFILGDDANAGTFALPKLTLANAYSTAVDGDTICFLTPNGRWFEDMSSGYLFFNKASLTSGIDFVSFDPSRPAKIGGVSGAFSVRVATSGHRFQGIDIYSGANANTSVVGCSSGTAITGIRFRQVKFVVNHDIDSTVAYIVQQAGAGLHTGWSFEDCELHDNCRLINGIYIQYSDCRIVRTKINLKRFLTATALRIGTSVATMHIESCELEGDVGILQSQAMTVNSQIQILNSKINGRSHSAIWNGSGSGTKLKLILRNINGVGEVSGFSVAGNNVVVDSHNHESLAGNVAMGYPTDGAYSDVTATVVDGHSTAWAESTGHAVLFGAGAVNPVLVDHHAVALFAPFAAVFKGTGGKVVRGKFVGGSSETLLFKGAVDWNLRDVEALQNVGGVLLEMRNGDTAPVASGMDIQNNYFLVTAGSLMDIGALTTQEDGTSIVDFNRYAVEGSGTWGTVRGMTVSSLDAVRAAWTGVETNDDNSYEPSFADTNGSQIETLERVRATSQRTQTDSP
jgi:hypothetical protein